MKPKHLSAILLMAFTTLFYACEEEDDRPSYYGINMKVTGNSLNHISFSSDNLNFDITENVPTHVWSAGNHIYGNDSITFYASQSVAAPLERVVLTLSLFKNGDPVTVFTDSGATEITMHAFIPF